MTVDAVIVGGGAAGIAAARLLNRLGRDVLLLEAGDRLGGRARTVVVEGMALDHGCGWLHSARRNPMVALAEAAGLAIDRSNPGWDRQWRDLGFPKDAHHAFDAAWERWSDRALAHRGPDVPLSAHLDADEPWAPLLDAISGFVNGAPLARVSTADWAAYEQAATEDNWRVREGYGTLIERLGDGLPVRLGTPVTRIDHGGRTIQVETSAGTIEARAVVLALPTPALARLPFTPDLPSKRAAAEALPLGLADKVFLAVEGGDLPTDGHLIGDPASARTASHRLGAFGWPLVESFFGGNLAEELERAGDGAAAAFAVDELVRLLGTDWRRRLRPIAATHWRAEPHIAGSYSHARVGAAGERRVLAQPIDGRLFFAGEACSTTDFSTCHGAWATGIAAAHALEAALAA